MPDAGLCNDEPRRTSFADPRRYGRGEASEVSSITMDGVLAADGGFANNGFGIDQHGNHGFLTSEQQLANGTVLTSLETFDQSTNASLEDGRLSEGRACTTRMGGHLGRQRGVVRALRPQHVRHSYNLLNLANGTVGRSWTPPFPDTLQIGEGGANQADDHAAFPGLRFDRASNSTAWRLFTSDITANTFGPLIDLTPAVASMDSRCSTGIGQNTATNQASTPATDFNNSADRRQW